MTKENKGRWGGKRPNTGGKREGAGRKPTEFRTTRKTFSYHIEVRIAKKLDEYAEMSGHTKAEIVEMALGNFFHRLRLAGFE